MLWGGQGAGVGRLGAGRGFSTDFQGADGAHPHPPPPQVPRGDTARARIADTGAGRCARRVRTPPPGAPNTLPPLQHTRHRALLLTLESTLQQPVTTDECSITISSLEMEPLLLKSYCLNSTAAPGTRGARDTEGVHATHR